MGEYYGSDEDQYSGKKMKRSSIYIPIWMKIIKFTNERQTREASFR